MIARIAETIRAQPARRRHRRAHLRRSLRAVLRRTTVDRCRAAVPRRACASAISGARVRSRGHADRAVDELRRRGRAEHAVSACRTRSPRRKSPARPPRIAAAVASRLYQDADRSIVRRYEDVAIVGNLREAIANDRFRMEAQPIVPLRPQRSGAALRAAAAHDRSVGREHRAGQVPHGRRALPARDRHRSLGRAVRAGDPVVGGAGARRARARISRSTSPASRSATSSSRRSSSSKLREYDLPPGLLSFEITETAAVANIVRAELLIRRLQDLGHAIALDDFGRGLSSLTYLKSLSGVGPEDRRRPGARSRRQCALAGDGDRDRAAGADDEAAAPRRNASKAKRSSRPSASSASTYGQGFAIGRPRPLEIVLQELLRGAPGVRAHRPARRAWRGVARVAACSRCVRVLLHPSPHWPTRGRCTMLSSAPS